MNFDFSPEQKAFAQQVRRLLQRECPIETVRLSFREDTGSLRPLWAALCQLGFPGSAIDAGHGGAGLGALELCAAAEELGRALAPAPGLASVYLCSEAIRLYGDAAQHAQWLGRLASGGALGAWSCGDGGPDGEGLPVLSAGRLYGTGDLVLNGMAGDVTVTLARSVDGTALLVLCPLHGDGVARAPVSTVDPTRPAARVVFDGAPADVLEGAGLPAFRRLEERAAVYLAFEQIGAADRALEMARDYALQRKSFGRPIGSYQAIKHKLAAIYADNQIARAHAYYGAWALHSGDLQLPLAAAGARVAASQALCAAAQENIQTHGGIGVTWDSDCHLFYRRARFDALVLGSPMAWRSRIVLALQRTTSTEGGEAA